MFGLRPEAAPGFYGECSDYPASCGWVAGLFLCFRHYCRAFRFLVGPAVLLTRGVSYRDVDDEINDLCCAEGRDVKYCWSVGLEFTYRRRSRFLRHPCN